MGVTNKKHGKQVFGGIAVTGTASVANLSVSGTLTTSQGVEGVQNTTVTSAELLALNATPKTVVTAPAAGYANVFLGAELMLDYATTAYDGIAAGEDLTFKYTDGSGAIVATVETTGFLDATADAIRYVFPATTAAVTPVAAAAIVLHLLIDEIATGDSPLKVRVYYKTIPIQL